MGKSIRKNRKSKQGRSSGWMRGVGIALLVAGVVLIAAGAQADQVFYPILGGMVALIAGLYVLLRELTR